MKSLRILLFLSIAGLSFSSFAANIPPDYDPKPKYDLRNLNAKSIEKLLGKKLTLIDKVKLFIVKQKLKKSVDDETMTEKQKDQATTSMIMGIASFGFLFLPIVVYLSIPLAILAIIFGIKSLKGNSNTKGIIGISFGAATILLLLIAVIVLASGGFWI